MHGSGATAGRVPSGCSSDVLGATGGRVPSGCTRVFSNTYFRGVSTERAWRVLGNPHVLRATGRHSLSVLSGGSLLRKSLLLAATARRLRRRRLLSRGRRRDCNRTLGSAEPVARPHAIWSRGCSGAADNRLTNRDGLPGAVPRAVAAQAAGHAAVRDALT